MWRVIRTFLMWSSVLCIGLALCLGLALFLVPGRYYGEWLAAQVTEVAHKNGVRVIFREPKVEGFSFKAEAIEAFVVPIFLPLRFEQVAFRPSWNLGRELGLAASARGYGGSWATTGRVNIENNKQIGEFSVQEMSVTQFPPLAALGLSAGTASIVVSDWALDLLSGSASAKVSMKLTNVSKPGPSKLPPAMTQLPIVIPEFLNLNLLMQGQLQGARVEADSFELDCSLGRAKGRFVGDFRGIKTAQRIDGEWVVNLTDTGVRDLGPWLVLLSRDTINAETRSVRISVRGHPAHPDVRITRAG